MVSCKGLLHSMSNGSPEGMNEHAAQTIAPQLSRSLIMDDIMNDVTRWRWQWVSCKGLHSMSFGSPEG
eukprot:scaffold19661_cov25-Cyclotella_meneghiniana.AAC.1